MIAVVEMAVVAVRLMEIAVVAVVAVGLMEIAVLAVAAEKTVDNGMTPVFVVKFAANAAVLAVERVLEKVASVMADAF